MDAPLPPLIQALLDPSRYPHPAAPVTLLQTHISWVLLAGAFAYKIKKPVALGFLDFSTLALRQRACDEELRLNRRYSPDLYLRRVDISGTPQSPCLDGAGPPIEAAVCMRRFDPEQQFDRLCARGALQASHLSALADTLADFHAAAERADPAAPWASPALVLAQAEDNFDALQRLLPDAGLAQALPALRRWTRHQAAQLAAQMQARKSDGLVRECHGDLHLGNLVLVDAEVRLFDCIEFSAELRWIDVASELAFTYADLLAHGQPGLAHWFLDEVLSRSGDYAAAPLLRFYAVYRALVRAKVAAIRASQEAGHLEEIARWIALAQTLSAPPSPALIITHGLSGCGKTLASAQLLQADRSAPLLRLRSDVERKRLVGLGPTERGGAQAGLYDASAHARTYARLRELAELLLRAGWSVIVDATFLRRADRDAFRALARQRQARFSILAPQATTEQLRQRIASRAAGDADASDATVSVLEAQIRQIEALDAQERRELWPSATTTVTDPARQD